MQQILGSSSLSLTQPIVCFSNALACFLRRLPHLIRHRRVLSATTAYQAREHLGVRTRAEQQHFYTSSNLAKHLLDFFCISAPCQYTWESPPLKAS
ncbi:hypothetical protein F7734_27255 [Scytonema sp. UIC 10036]|uniref:hypothetical protein n=1 Tax=Scytonema sp. UIC 10036 TaxID=2304196 RepID=UPI0012DA93D8|nr:hypothetical protein [Scytonema sp. UIC 10036]MUG95855.1 hypothetical protein [Scytonema sp. UIC 10036]